MSRRVHASAKEDDVLSDGGVEEVHGSHPSTTVHEYPLTVATGKNMRRVRLSQLFLHE